MSLSDALSVYERWLYLPDPDAAVAVLGALAANRLDGDPVWFLLVGPPGGGKTELLQSAGGLEGVHQVGTLTEAALLSGTPKREANATSTGGLLRTIGDHGIILCKDFGSVLSMHRDARASVLAALREIYDGSWTRLVGTNGGQTLHWEGCVGFLAGCTQTIDRHHAVMGSMGERFALYRLRTSNADEHARRSLAHAGRETTMRSDLRWAVVDLFNSVDFYPPPADLTTDEQGTLVSLAVLAVRCRSAVERDGRDRDIELIPDPEAPTRLVVQLARLLAGLRRIGAEDDQAWRIVRKVALDSIPDLRRNVLEQVAAGEQATTAIAEACDYPTTTVRRACEDLAAHHIITRKSGGSGKSDTWLASPWLVDRWNATAWLSQMTVPETSGGIPLNSPISLVSDISGTVPDEPPPLTDEELEHLFASQDGYYDEAAS
jgi:hypothetical protein